MKSFFKELEALQKKDEISLLELEFGRFIHSLDSTMPNNVILSGMFCVHNQMNGHICCSLSDILANPIYAQLLEPEISKQSLLEDIRSSNVVGQPGENKPLILDGENLYLQKLWKYEQELADFIIQKSKITHSLDKYSIKYVDELFKEDSSNQNLQKVAVLLSLAKDLVIISGGPGTGKTFTIKKIIEALHSKKKNASFALATPTGKAAQRLNESLRPEASEFPIHPATTIHKLLQARGNSGNFKYNEKNKLPFDVLIIDEASMLDINLWIRLLRAIPKTAKLILLGDKNQLASVEAGSILGDICSESTNDFSVELSDVLSLKTFSTHKSKPINDCIIELTKSYRFDEEQGIGVLSRLINIGSSKEVVDLLNDDSYPETTTHQPTNEVVKKLIRDFVINPFLENKRTGFSIESFKSHQILCALRKGPYGVEYINDLAETSLKKELGIKDSEEWYEGRPVLITRNNALLKIRNGEIGICKKNMQSGLFEIQLEQREESPISISRIQNYEPAFATTIHKSQGSEYDHVSIMLSNQPNALLSKQLLYTAVTRARKSVLVIASEVVITSTVQKNIVRRSGLRDKIWLT